MRRESQAPDMYEDIIREYGAPNKMVTDNTKVCTGKDGQRSIVSTALQLVYRYHITNIRIIVKVKVETLNLSY